jgi:hypothetical protein
MLFYVSGGDTAVTARYIAAAQQRRAQALPPALLAQVQATFVSIAVSDEETAATMARVHAESGFVLDPHSAVGVCGASDVRIRAALHAAVNNPICCVLTAHPAKFEGACVRAGVPVDTSRVDMLKTMSHKFKELRAPPAGVDKLAAVRCALRPRRYPRSMLPSRRAAHNITHAVLTERWWAIGAEPSVEPVRARARALCAVGDGRQASGGGGRGCAAGQSTAGDATTVAFVKL